MPLAGMPSCGSAIVVACHRGTRCARVCGGLACVILNGQWAAPAVMEAEGRPAAWAAFASHREMQLYWRPRPCPTQVWCLGARFKASPFGGRKHQKYLCHFLPGDRLWTRQQQRPETGCGHVAVAAGKWGPQERVAQPPALGKSGCSRAWRSHTPDRPPGPPAKAASGLPDGH